MDDADFTSNVIDIETERAILKIRNAAAQIPPGEPGDCEMCGEWFSRLVNSVCARCRDKYKLK